MWTHALEDTLRITKENIVRFHGRFPHVSNGDAHYVLTNNTDWTEGFWSGILWLSYEYSKEPIFRDAAYETVASFRKRMDGKIELDHHDIGFLYSLSSKAQWILEQDEEAKRLTLEAADVLMNRWRHHMQIIQAWGKKDDPVNGGRIIIDCLMNLPLLGWASEETGNPVYAEAARVQAEKSRRFLVRGDDSSYHTFYFDQETGDSHRGGTHQGFRDGSTWSRGQAWGIYGFALAYQYFKLPEFLETSKRMAHYFVKHLPEDFVAYWDFNAPQAPGTPRDSSASAIAACGMLEIIRHLKAHDPERTFFQEMAERTMASLYKNYSTGGDPKEQGFLRHGSYSVRGGVSPDDYVIWGDYYYLEALMRLARNAPGYWYDRPSSQ